MSRGSSLIVLILTVIWMISSPSCATIARHKVKRDASDVRSSPVALPTKATPFPGRSLNGTPSGNITSAFQSNQHRRWRLPFLRTMFQRLTELHRKKTQQRRKRETDTGHGGSRTSKSDVRENFRQDEDTDSQSDRQQRNKRLSHRLKRYLEIVRVKIPSLDFAMRDKAKRNSRVSGHLAEFLESVPHENREVHTVMAQSNPNVSRDKHDENGGQANKHSSTNASADMTPSLLSSLNNLLANLDVSLVDLLEEASAANDTSRTLVRRERPSLEGHEERQNAVSLPPEMRELVEQLDRKSKRKWAYERTNAVGEMHHVAHAAPDEKGVVKTKEQDIQALKKIHHYNVPAYKHELREAKQMLQDLQEELEKRKKQWAI